MATNTSYGNEKDIYEFKANCAIFPPSSPPFAVPPPIVFSVPIPLDGNANASETFGPGKHFFAPFTEPEGKTNCHGTRYEYKQFDIKHYWQVDVFVPGHGVQFCTHGRNLAFWDWYYREYDGPSSCDYSQNCHGFSLGTGDWISPSAWIPCYEATTEKELAEVAVSNDPPEFTHSIKVTGGLCPAELEPGIATAFPGTPLPGDPTGPLFTGVFKGSSEQYRESGTYTQQASCDDVPPSVNISLAHGRGHATEFVDGVSGAATSPFGPFDDYTLAKKKGN